MRDHDAVDIITTQLYAVFHNIGGTSPAIDALCPLFRSDARIVKAVTTVPESMSLREFVESRRAILSDGTLIDFDEWEPASPLSQAQVAGLST